MPVDKIELLNSEGPILTVVKKDKYFEIIDQYQKSIAIYTEKQIIGFVHGDLIIIDSRNRSFVYSRFPGSMKPDLKRLDEFIGIDTRGKKY